MDMEEKAFASTFVYRGHKITDSLEEKVSVFLHEEDFHPSDPSFDGEDDGDDLQDSMERTLYWESQEALLQEVLERCSLTGLKIRQEISRIIEKAKEIEYCHCVKLSSNGCSSCLRVKVVDLLSLKGFNASLCTSKWKNTQKFPGGKHEYIEVIVNTSGRKKQITYLIELEFKDQFEIAKACDEYKKLIAQLPKYYIGKADYLNAIVGIICDSAKRSMKEKKIHMGPWRKRSFMQMKWSNSSSKGLIDESRMHFSAAPAMICT
ncbi:hypothetical protein JCGZ_17234 [Jatropha curcas]|uniref:Uncharacterized protein n=1 Tax=Jatropha curcas TaxID=180498 RepID=A0A067LB45_JATCU|nr:uncharacterized protein LOC105638154 [Jatropha curcas]KDP45627.1 hypothetical protein JCGZ_17234 [Jatropha curcas]